MKTDFFHAAPTSRIGDISRFGTVTRFAGGDGVEVTLIQMPGALGKHVGRFEWIVDDLGRLTHQMFVKNGTINGIPIKK